MITDQHPTKQEKIYEKKDFFFEILYQSKKSKARVGKIHTPHGIIDTPNFVGVGTNAALKALDSVSVDNLGLQLLFCNTYHLLIQPGADIIEKAGGLHRFMNRNMPLITDSGGFQVFSLAYGGVADELKSKGTKKLNSSVLKISENGVLFRSYKNGDPILLTPENSVEAQKKLGADIIIPFDELLPAHAREKQLKESLFRTHRWQERSLQVHLENKKNQAMYAVIHGGINEDFRKLSCKILSNLSFDGFAIGGSLGKNREEMAAMLSYTIPELPYEKPNHLLGIGDLPSIDACISLGIDTFDSSYPTKCARHGVLFTKNQMIKIVKSEYKEDFSPIAASCFCFTCQNYTKAYLHHLFKAHELTAYTLATIHNVYFMVELMNNYRKKILHDEF